MEGDERVRFCSQCKLNVFNLSSMSRREAEALVRSKEGRLCIRFYRRSDGTILTDNCPVGLRAARRRVALLLAGAATLFTSWSIFAQRGPQSGQEDLTSPDPFQSLRRHQPFKTVLEWVDPAPSCNVVTGEMAPPTKSAPTPPPTAPQISNP